ncbi:30S ribosomal protein S12 methylthiotransferase RimO [bacterium]|nr:30S ribosomal protein S12 methylthiotransferase RimO [bacterium]
MRSKQHCSNALRQPRAAIHTLGCPKNTVDSDALGRVLGGAGFELVQQESKADILIINTCGFLDDAKIESVQVLLEAIRWKAKKPGRRVLAMGCLTQRDGAEIHAEMPELDGVFGIGEWSRMIEALGSNPLSLGNDTHEELEAAGEAGPGSAYLRISDGCSHACAFCSIPQMRGLYRSEPIERLVAQANILAERGIRELILIGQETTSYGVDLYRRRRIVELCNRLSEIEGIHWIRMLYAHPPTCPPELMKELARVPKLAPYIDFPIEHASDRVLKLMNRRTTALKMRKAIDVFRSELPDACIRTTILVGFPGETDEDFEALYNFMSEVQFERAGVFTYSPQQGTTGATLSNRVEQGIALDRLDRLMNLQRYIMREKHKARIGRLLEVLIEKQHKDISWGRSAWDAPGIDARVRIPGQFVPGTIVRASVVKASAYQLDAMVDSHSGLSNQGDLCAFSEFSLLS